MVARFFWGDMRTHILECATFIYHLRALYPFILDIPPDFWYNRDMMSIMDIRDRTPTETLDYQQLMSLLRGYAKPRDRIGAFMDKGELIRVRRGLYVFGERYRRGPLRRETLANLIYGPSYVSLDFMLSWYGMIPERVEDVTCVTTGEKKRFTTPLGVFTYQPMTLRRYSPGIAWSDAYDSPCLIASPEKALVDKVWMDKRFSPTRLSDFDAYLFDDLRIDEALLATLDMSKICSIARIFGARKIAMLTRFLARVSQQRSVASANLTPT